PGLRVGRDHGRDHDGAVRPQLLHLGDLLEVDLYGPVRDELDVVDGDEAVAAELECPIAVADVEDGVADGLPDGATPAVLESLVDLVRGVRGRRGRKPERVG